MLVGTTDNQLIIEANVSAKDTFLHLGVGFVFAIGGGFLLNTGVPMGWLFLGGGVLALASFAVKANQSRITYRFDRAAQKLSTDRGHTIPFDAIRAVSVRADTWRGTYGEGHVDHSVYLDASIHGQFVMPANSLAEANRVVYQIQETLGRSLNE